MRSSREAVDEPALARHDALEVDGERAGVDAEPSGHGDVVRAIARRDQRLRRHAAAQDAQAAQRPVVDEGDFRAQRSRRARGGIAARTRPHDDQIVREALHVPYNTGYLRMVTGRAPSRCTLSTCRIVPLRECITIECVRALLPKNRTPRTRSPSVIPVATNTMFSPWHEVVHRRGRGRGRRSPSRRHARLPRRCAA